MHLSRALVLTFFTLLLYACASSDPYPVDWEPLPIRTSGDCSQFEGIYHMREMSQAPNDESLTLLKLVFPEYIGMGRPVYMGFLALSNDVLEVSVLGADKKPIDTKRLTTGEGDYYCEDGYSVIKSRGDVGGGGVLGLESQSFLGRCRDDVCHGCWIRLAVPRAERAEPRYDPCSDH